jgi:hypothetical protein
MPEQRGDPREDNEPEYGADIVGKNRHCGERGKGPEKRTDGVESLAQSIGAATQRLGCHIRNNASRGASRIPFPIRSTNLAKRSNDIEEASGNSGFVNAASP